MSKRIDLLNGNIFSSLTRLALPIMATSLIQMAYNLTDMIWIGRLGSSEVAAVGAASMYLWLSNALATLARMGGQVKTAQALGGGDSDKASRYAQNAIQLGAVLAIIYSVVMVIFVQPLIGFFKLNGEQVIKNAEIYLIIVGGGLVFSILNQILTGLITATGNSKTPFLATMIGLAVNIVLDPLLIFGLGPIPAMGVAGAAAATVLAQAIVTFMFVIYMVRDKLVFSRIKLFARPDPIMLKGIVQIGLPTAVQSAMFTFISMIIARLIAGWGDAAIAVQKVGSQIESISWMTADGFAAAVNSFVAQNHGAGNNERALKGYKVSFIVMSAWGVVSSLLLIFLAGPLFNIFIPDPQILPLGISYLVILGFSQYFMCVEIMTEGAFAGFSKSFPPALASILLTAARIPMAIWLAQTPLALDGIWWSISISSILKGIVVPVLFFIFIKRSLPGWRESKQWSR